MKVPFLDLKAQYETIRDEIAAALQEVLESSAFAGGPFVERFEQEFARSCGTGEAVGLGSGTEALWASLVGLGIGRGDEVITVPNTFIATAEAISLAGARPVFVDIDERTFNIKVELIEQAITSRTRAIIPVHLFGQPADMDPIMEIARAYDLFVIEDACQAHGARYKGRAAGAIGDAGCFSFYPGKNLGAYGEAGAVVTSNPELARKIRMFRDHGQAEKYRHLMRGWNARMDGFQGAVLRVKLKHLSRWNDARRANALLYNELLEDIEGVVTPLEADYAEHVYHVYALLVENRDAFMEALRQKGIGCGIHYPACVHLQQAFGFLGYGQGDFPVAEGCAERLVSLPMFAELSRCQIEFVVEAIKDFVGR